jgi:DNA-binding NarL/FixJ family response regulator
VTANAFLRERLRAAFHENDRVAVVDAAEQSIEFAIDALVVEVHGRNQASADTRSHDAEAGTLLTPRESEIVTAVVAGWRNRDIAAEFAITETTVKHHLSNIFDKVGVSSRLELAMFSQHHDLDQRDRAGRARRARPIPRNRRPRPGGSHVPFVGR